MGEEREPASLDEWLRSWVTDPALRPILIVVVAIMATNGAAVLVLSLGDRNPFALAALAILIVASLREGFRFWREGRRGIVAGIALMWGLSALGAGAAALWLPS
ncbi:MAG: hypothetical protein JRH01_25265 [Deltaproteobacteria bacterium]|nr:hypothetical protein [Deltaproteobacteria bacterium]MBW2396699.1 hypothetical protein [Deltaproteobacteria bacterium]